MSAHQIAPARAFGGGLGGMVLALDPGTTETGYVMLHAGKVAGSGVKPNAEIVEMLLSWRHAHFEPTTLAIEMIASYGMPVGREVFETCVWIGRFSQAWHEPGAALLVYRKDVKLHLCHNPRAKDPNIRQALLDKVGPQGTKKDPGPTYGVKSHAWAALAVGVTVAETVLRWRITKAANPQADFLAMAEEPAF